MNEVNARRKRGVILSAGGLRRLNQAIHAVEADENDRKRFTAEQLSQLTDISTSTLSRLWAAKSGVDRRTLHLLFSAFKLDLGDEDIQQASDDAEGWVLPESGASATTPPLSYPSGPVPLDSCRYISRPAVDDRTLQQIHQPGCVIRIKAPNGFGKSSLLLRLLHHAQQLGYATARLDLHQVDTDALTDPHAFLRWLCKALSLKVSLKPDLEQYWDDLLGSKLSATLYVREAILAQLPHPLVLVINEVEWVFEYPNTAKHLLPMLRSWHEEAQHDPIWQRLRLVVAYATDAYLPLDINQSPFNIGLPITLPEFTPEQVRALAALYPIQWSEPDCDRLLALIGGHPSLVGLALYHLHHGMALVDLLQSACTQQGIYRNHLQHLLAQVSRHPHWQKWLSPLLQGHQAIALDPMLAYKLEGMGLIKPAAGGWQLTCELYRVYFQTCLLKH